MRMKTIALVTIDLFKIGGTERVVCNLANLFAGTYKVVILSCYDERKMFYELDDRVEVRCLGLEEIPSSLTGKIGWYARFVRLLKAKVRADQVDILLGTTHALNSMLPLVKGRSRMRIVGCEHIVYETVPRLYSAIRRVMYPWLDAVVVLTQAARAHYGYHAKAVVIPNYAPEVDEADCSPLTDMVALAIGRYDYGKSFERLIRIASLVKQQVGTGVQFRIVGEGEYKDKFLRLMQELDVTDVVTLVPPTKNVAQEYKHSSMYLMTSRSEALPMVLLEAKAYGLPIISFACQEGPVSLIRHREDGYLVPDDDLQGFAQCVVELVRDEKKRTDMGAASRKSLAAFRKETVWEQWKTLFQSL